MKKIFNSRITQILSLTLFISIISILVYSSINKVNADDKVNTKVFNERVMSIDKKVEQLEASILELKAVNKDLESNVTEAKQKITELEKKLTTYEKNVTSINNKVIKIENREDIFYERLAKNTPSGSVSNVGYYMIEEKTKNN